MRDEALSSPHNPRHPHLPHPAQGRQTHDPSCNSDSASPSSSVTTNQRSLQSGLIDSPLRLALQSAKTTPPPSPGPASLPAVHSSTPLLKASLNSPPVAHSSAATSPAATSATLSVSSASTSSSSTNGSVDLSLGGRKRRIVVNDNNNQMEDKARPAEMYANLIMQLSQNQGNRGNAVPPSPSSSSSVAAGNKKEKSCFQCPACKKRFQRHIAMNAHFQNEHIGQVQSDKVCRICPAGNAFSAKNMAGVRAHLLAEHQIDLETPASSTMTEKASPSSPSAAVAAVKVELVTAASSTNNNNNNRHPKFRPALPRYPDKPGETEAKDGCHLASSTLDKAAPSVTIKKETAVVDDEARDLSVRREPAVSISVKRKKVGTPSPSASPPPDVCQYQCQHCSIVFPNQTLYFLHRGFHSDANPWRCNGCGVGCRDMYDFNTHLVSESHN